MFSPWFLKKVSVSASDEAMEARGEATPWAVQVFFVSNLLLQRAIACHVGNLSPSSEASLLARSRESQSKQAIPSGVTRLDLRNSCVFRQASSDFSREAKIKEEGGSFWRRGSSRKRRSVRKRRDFEYRSNSFAT
jgi:hypothetical protein